MLADGATSPPMGLLPVEQVMQMGGGSYDDDDSHEEAWTTETLHAHHRQSPGGLLPVEEVMRPCCDDLTQQGEGAAAGLGLLPVEQVMGTGANNTTPSASHTFQTPEDREQPPVPVPGTVGLLPVEEVTMTPDSCSLLPVTYGLLPVAEVMAVERSSDRGTGNGGHDEISAAKDRPYLGEGRGRICSGLLPVEQVMEMDPNTDTHHDGDGHEKMDADAVSMGLVPLEELPLPPQAVDLRSAPPLSSVVATTRGGGESWFEYRQFFMDELLVQREEMLKQIAGTHKSALFGLELLSAKLEQDSTTLRSECRRMLEASHQSERNAWREIANEQQRCAQLFGDVEDLLAESARKSKELFLCREEQEAYLKEREEAIETWSASLQRELVKREDDLNSKQSALERETAQFVKAVEAKDPGLLSSSKSGASPTKRTPHFAKILRAGAKSSATEKTNEMTRAVVGEPLSLLFRVEPFKDLVGLPVSLTYLDGRGGSVGGNIVVPVAAQGEVKFQNITFNGRPNTSHLALVSVPRSAAGTVEPLELPVLLMPRQG